MENIEKMIFESYKETNNSLDIEEKTESFSLVPLYGENSSMDSLGLVSFLINLEQKIEDQLGITITIADEKAMSLKNSPFRTIGTLSEYLKERLIKINE